MKEDLSMKCPKCGCRIPDNSDSWLYWGTWIKGEASSETSMEFPTLSVSSGKMNENITGIQATKEEINNKKLDGLPLSIRARVEEILKKGEGPSEEIRTSCTNILGTKERSGSKRKSMGSLKALRSLMKKE